MNYARKKCKIQIIGKKERQNNAEIGALNYKNNKTRKIAKKKTHMNAEKTQKDKHKNSDKE